MSDSQMQLSLTKLPWYAQIGAFVVLAMCFVVPFFGMLLKKSNRFHESEAELRVALALMPYMESCTERSARVARCRLYENILPAPATLEGLHQ